LEFDEPIYPQYEPVPDMFQKVPAGCPVRLVIDLKKQELITRQPLTYCCSPDFPALNPRQAMECYDDFWMLGISSTGGYGRKFFDQLVHLNWSEKQSVDIYQSPAQCYLGGEPVFVGESGSAAGVVISQEFDARASKSYFLVFDAGNVSAGPIARIPLEHGVHLGFHAAFKSFPAS
jgi:all-trans-8'-apo-beta-carotenal 15,15'-oxygenase